MDLGGLLIRVDRRADLDEIAVAAQPVDEALRSPNTLAAIGLLRARPRLVVAATVDARNFPAHRPQIRGELSAMMHHVDQGEEHVVHRRHLHPKEIHDLRQLVAIHRQDRLERLREILLVPLPELGHAGHLGFAGGWIAELAVQHAVEEPHVRAGNVGGEVKRRPRVGVRLVILLAFRHRRQHLEGRHPLGLQLLPNELRRRLRLIWFHDDGSAPRRFVA